MNIEKPFDVKGYKRGWDNAGRIIGVDPAPIPIKEETKMGRKLRMKDLGITIMEGACIELMGSIPDQHIDMVLCDLPYGMTACPWDSVIPFEALWGQYTRVIKPTGAIVLFGSQPFTSALIMSNPKWFKYSLIWEKDNATGFLNSKKRVMKIHEDINIFYASQCTYNPQMRPGKPYKCKAGQSSTGGLSVTKDRNIICGGHVTESNGEGYPTSILKFNSERGYHPTQKPVELLNYLIRTYTNEGETVLDNCMGSGSTGVAAKQTGRKFIGMELDTNYFDIAKDRIRG